MRPKLGELLVQAGVLTRRQIETALDQQRREPGHPKLGEVLLQMRVITETVILDVLSRALHLKSVDLSREIPQEAALALMTPQEAEKNLMLPLRVDTSGQRRRLVVAVADPTNVQVIDDLQFKTGMVVQPMLSTMSQVRQAVRRHYHWKAGEEISLAVDEPIQPRVERSKAETWIGPAPGSLRPAEAAAKRNVADLEFFAGPDRGKTIHLEAGSSLVFGRGEDADVTVSDMRMSRRHFVIVGSDEGVEMVDMGSSNGTTVNQRQVNRASLKSGDFVQAGDTIIGVKLL